MSALAGIRVLDLTRVISGPYCTMYLADHGADVIKIESSDRTPREMGPMDKGRDGLGFLAVNRNKRSVVLDLKNPKGLDVLLRMVADADVLVENYRPGVMDRLGLGWQRLHEVNPRLIYTSISGFGQDGPYASRPGYDLLAQAMSGLMSITGHPGQAPVKVGVPISDLTAGMVAAQATLTALFHRERTGDGQRVEASLLDTAVSLGVWESVEYWGADRVPQPLGSAHRASAPYQALRASDGYLVVAANTQRFFQALCDALGAPDLLDDPRFATNADRLKNVAALVSALETMTSAEPSQALTERLIAAGVPAAPIYTYDEVFSDPQVLAREMVVEVEHPAEGRVKALGIPSKLSKTPGSVRTAAPLLGADTVALLQSTGFTAEEITALRRDGAVSTDEDLA